MIALETAMFRSRPFHAFKDDEQWIVYFPDLNRACREEAWVIEILNALRSPGSVSRLHALLPSWKLEDIQSAVERLVAGGLLISPGETRQNREPHHDRTEGLPLHLNVNVAQQCNLRCRYCYAHDGTYDHPSVMTPETATQTVNFLFRQAAKENRPEVGWTFFGGEPLVNPEVIYQTTLQLRQRERETGCRVELSIATNGTLLDERMARFFKEQRVHVTISVDGPGPTNDALRPAADGEPSFERSLRGLHRLKEAGVTDVQARSTVTALNPEIAENTMGLLDAGFDRVGFALVRDEGGEFELNPSVMKRLLHELEAIGLATGARVVAGGKLPVSNFIRPLLRLHLQSEGRHPCGAGRSLFHVTTDGKIFPCQAFYALPEWQLGDIWTGLDDLKVRHFQANLPVEKRRGCRACTLRHLCGGECYFHSMMETGDMSRPHRTYCAYTRRQLEVAIALYVRLREEAPERLEAIMDGLTEALRKQQLRGALTRILMRTSS